MTKSADHRHVDAVIVGAGFGGLYALHRMRELGLDVVCLEKASDVGGVWYWNRYPGARCDVPSLLYSYTWSPELRKEWRWTQRYADQAEILRYAGHVAEKFDLKRSIRFGTQVLKTVWDDEGQCWHTQTAAGEVFVSRFCVMATGCLSVPNKPGLPGIESFEGEVYHTGDWPHEPVSFAGQKVAVIGTGSSGIQAIPLIAREAERLTVFQRTPNYSIPARNRPLEDEDVETFEGTLPALLESMEQLDFGRVPASAFDAPVPTHEEQTARYEAAWQLGGGSGFLTAFPNILTNEAVNDTACDFVRERIREIVKDPATADSLSPKDYPLGVKRICVDTNYFETFNRDNVDLVDLRREPITAIGPQGIATSERTMEFDALVLATGYDAITGALNAIDIRGRDDVSLKETWAAGPSALLGLMSAGFPNLFIITGPGSPSVIGNVIYACQNHVDWIANCIEALGKKGRHVIEAEAEAQEAWMKHVAEAAAKTLYLKAATWYQGANIEGKPRVFMPYVGQGYRHKIAAVAQSDYQGFVKS